MWTIDEAPDKLKASKFRAGFALKEKDKAFIREKGMDTIRHYAQDFVRERLAPAAIPNDGKHNRCTVIRYSLHSMLAPVVVGDASTSGTMCPKALN